MNTNGNGRQVTAAPTEPENYEDIDREREFLTAESPVLTLTDFLYKVEYK